MRLVKGWGRETVWLLVVVAVVAEVRGLSGSNVCMVQQKYNITKRVKYRAPMSVRSYVWCFSIPPRCSIWKTEMRDLTRLETEERNAEVAVCCPGYKMKDISCIPICPNGKTGRGCTEDCPPNKWGPNCVHECKKCRNGFCSPVTGECDCLEGWQGESCQTRMSTTPAATALTEELLTSTKSSIQTLASIKPIESTSKSTTPLSSTINLVTQLIATSSKITTMKPPVSTTIIRTTTALSTTISSTSPLTTTTGNVYDNVTLPLQSTLWTKSQSITESPKTLIKTYAYNRTETPVLEPKGTSAPLPKHVTMNTMNSSATTKIPIRSTNTKSATIATKLVKASVHTNTENESTTLEMKTTKKSTTTKSFPSTIKLKTKEIWIKPTQKGETPIIETKHKAPETPYTRIKSAINKDELPIEVTTPKTIIVSIIPTSISHATFKKIALTTVPYNMSHKNNVTSKFPKRMGTTKSLDLQTSTTIPYTIKILHPNREKKLNVSESNRSLIHFSENKNASVTYSKKLQNGYTSETSHTSTAKPLLNSTTALKQTTNSMSTTNEASGIKLNLSTLLTNKAQTNYNIENNTIEITTASSSIRPQYTKVPTYRTQNINKLTTQVGITKMIANVRTTKLPTTKHAVNVNTTQKVHKKVNTLTTKEPVEDETFHILTEPEHITAVMTDKEREHTSVDLISVISIAGGVMMAVITVAVVIVMVERCRRPRYDDVRKMDNMRMETMIDSDDEPPPYVRSIFHTPLPEPPTEKCHYQPITTLDRNLKQFMRPVVVQTISPVMLENFRGILECHYDHLPRRPHDFEIPLRSSLAPSTNYSDELRPLSVATIEALKCEAKFDIIDNTTSEPLYAEIPCWRPPSEHAVEVNLNGEAVTEL